MQLTQLPGCCGVGVVHGFFEHHRPTKDAHKALRELLEIADQEPDDEDECAGYGIVYATLNTGQVYSGLGMLLKEHGFVLGHVFVNPKTDNTIHVFSRPRPSK